MNADDDDVAVLQRLLAAEHAAVYGYGVLGARLDEPGRTLALQSDDAHRSRRDLLRSALLDRGTAPVDGEAAYALPEPVRDPSSAIRLGLHLEDGLAAHYAAALGDTGTVAVRSLAVAALQDAAVRAARLRTLATPGRAAPVAFPGLPA